MNLSKNKGYLEGSLLPQAKFLQETYVLAISRYHLSKSYAQNKIILDAGCGSGYGSEMLLKAGANKVYGLDICPESIEYCRTHHKQANLVFNVGDLTNIDFPDQTFDLICAFEVIEHIENYKQTMREFYRVLKPHGLLIISTPNKAIYSPWTKKPFYPFHYHEFYLKDFKNLLQKFQLQKICSQYIKGRKMLLYQPWDPRKYIRIIFTVLPFGLKVRLMKLYLRIFSWLYQSKIYHPKQIALGDVYCSQDLSQGRIFIAICQKSKEKNAPSTKK